MQGAPRETSEVVDDQVYGSGRAVRRPYTGKAKVVGVVTTTAMVIITARILAKLTRKSPQPNSNRSKIE